MRPGLRMPAGSNTALMLRLISAKPVLERLEHVDGGAHGGLGADQRRMAAVASR